MRAINCHWLRTPDWPKGLRHLNPPFARAIVEARNLSERTGFTESALRDLATGAPVSMSWRMYTHLLALAAQLGYTGELFHEPGCPCGKEVA